MLQNVRYNLYRAKYQYGRHLPLRAPVDVSLELASACNQKCGYCYHSDPKNLQFTTGLMKKEIAYKIIRQAAEMGVNSLKFNWKGESTLNPFYREITTYAKSLAKGSTFIDRLANSNFKIPKYRTEDIFKGLCSLTKVKVSFDSLDKEVFEYQRAGGVYDVALDNIDRFYNLPERLESGTKLVIQAVRTNLNLNEDFSRFNERWPEAEISIRDVVEGRVEKDVDEFTHRDRDVTERQSCKQAHVRLIFNKDGNAYPCCPDVSEQLYQGNIEQNSIKEIFNSYQARELRKQLKNKTAFINDPCKSCSSFETFKGFKPNWDS